jgi:hypothetical protein
MRVTAHIFAALGAVAAMQVAAGGAACAQAMTPMRGEVKSFTDRFAIRVFPANPYPRRIKIEVKAYDENFAPINAVVMPQAVMLAPEDNRSVMVLVPFEGKSERRVRICAESIPFEDKSTRLRTQVCGRFLAQRLR